MIASELVDDLNRPSAELRDAMWLALVPLGVALVLGVLLLPRRAAPESVPLPVADARRARARRRRRPRARRARAPRSPCPDAVRALGSALRDFHTLEAAGAESRELVRGPRAVDAALVDAMRGRASSRCWRSARCSSRGSSTRCIASRRRASSRPSSRRSPGRSSAR